MINSIQGKKYKFEIIWQMQDKEYQFFIKAIDKLGGRTSCINNLNLILSEFNIETNNPKTTDSIWTVTKKEAQRFYNIANFFLLDTCYMDYIERRLDEDKEAGEWENNT